MGWDSVTATTFCQNPRERAVFPVKTMVLCIGIWSLADDFRATYILTFSRLNTVTEN